VIKPLVPITLGATAKGWHEIESLVACPKEYQFSRIRGITPRSIHIKESLSIGSLFHAARAQWLADNYQGERWREAIRNYAKEHEAVMSARLSPGAVAAATELAEEYVDYWSLRPKPKVLAVEYTFRARPLRPGAPKEEWRTARPDSIELHRGRTWIGEAKTTSYSMAKVKDTYMLSGQTLLACTLWSELETKKFGPLAGVLLDGIKKRSGKTRPKCFPRVELPLSEMSHALSWFPGNFTDWIRQSSLVTWDADVPRNVTACMRPYGPCAYRALCLRGRAGALGFVFSGTNTPITDWEPEADKEVPPWV